MVGPLKKAPGGHTHLLVAVDKFTKWIEAKPIMNVRSQEAVEFFLNIVYRFGIPNCIIIDNRTNFTRKKFLDFYDGYGIRVDWALVRHPRTNGQVKRANNMVLQGLKPRIFDRLKKCRAMGHRAPCSPLEPENDSKPINGVHPLLLGIRFESSVAIRPRLWRPMGKSV